MFASKLNHGRLVVIPANAGTARTPAWWLNFRDGGTAVVEIAGRRQTVSARVTEGAEREDLWERYVRPVEP